jgi:hypothetical protein
MIAAGGLFHGFLMILALPTTKEPCPMASRKLPKRLFKNKDVIHTYQHERENKHDMKTLSRDHLDVLQNIEFTLVSAAKQEDDIDDRTIDQALTLALGKADRIEDFDPLAAAIYEVLEHARASRQDVTDTVWQAALKTVRDSVRRHSSLAAGEKAYLQFVAPYVR